MFLYQSKTYTIKHSLLFRGRLTHLIKAPIRHTILMAKSTSMIRSSIFAGYYRNTPKTMLLN